MHDARPCRRPLTSNQRATGTVRGYTTRASQQGCRCRPVVARPSKKVGVRDCKEGRRGCGSVNEDRTSISSVRKDCSVGNHLDGTGRIQCGRDPAPARPGSPSPTLRIVIVPVSAIKMPPWPSSDTPVTVHILTAKPGRQRARTHRGVSLSLSLSLEVESAVRDAPEAAVARSPSPA